MPSVDVPDRSEQPGLAQEMEDPAAVSWGLRLLFVALLALGMILLADLVKAIWRT